MDRRIQELEQQVASQSREIAYLKRQQALSAELQPNKEIKKLRGSRTHEELHHLDDNMIESNVTSLPAICGPICPPQTDRVPNRQLGGPPLFTTLNHLPQHPYSMNPLVHPSNAIPPTLTEPQPAPLHTPDNGFFKPSRLSNRFSMPASKPTFPTANQQAPKICSLVASDSSEEDSDSIRDTRESKRSVTAHRLLERRKPCPPAPAEPGPFGPGTASILERLQSQSSQKLSDDCSLGQEQTSDEIYVSCPMHAEPDDDLKQYKLAKLVPAHSFQVNCEENLRFYPIMVTVGADGRFQRLPSDTEMKEPKFRLKSDESSTVKQASNVDGTDDNQSSKSLSSFQHLLLNTSTFYSPLQGCRRFEAD